MNNPDTIYIRYNTYIQYNNIFSDQEYTFQITMRQLWMDQRLQYEDIKKQKKIPDSK